MGADTRCMSNDLLTTTTTATAPADVRGLSALREALRPRRTSTERTSTERGERRALARAARAKRRAVAMEIAGYPATRSASTAVLPMHLRSGL